MGTGIGSVSLFSVAMYYVSEQKVVAVFKSANAASMYVFGKAGYVTGESVSAKRVHKTNPYEMAITFRVAQPEHLEKLGRGDFVILDKRFIRKDSERSMRPKLLSGSEYNPAKGHHFNTEVDVAILKRMAAAGYTVDEIAEHMNMKKSSIAYFIKKHEIPVLLGFGINSSVEELKDYISLLQVRLNRLEKEQI